MKCNVLYSYVAPALIAISISNVANATATLHGEKGPYVWASTYVKTVKSKRNVEDDKREIVCHFKCVIKKDNEVLRSENIVSNGNWMGERISKQDAGKSAADVCKLLAGKTKR